MYKRLPYTPPKKWFWILTIVTLIGCSYEPGLGPVSGVEGQLEISGVWPDTLEAVVLVIVNRLDPEALQDVLVSYSDPLIHGDMHQDFFIQLQPGAYSLVPVGVTIDPGFLIANLDSILAAPHLPLVPLFDMTTIPPIGIHPIAIAKETINVLDDTVKIEF